MCLSYKFTTTFYNSRLLNVSHHTSAPFVSMLRKPNKKNIKGFTGAGSTQQQTLIILEKSSQEQTWVIAKDTATLS